MCGIIGFTGSDQAQPYLIGGLKALEYRGYDSAGVAIEGPDGRIRTTKRLGKVKALEGALADRPTPGTCGIAHTRWATHGVPSERNAHPFCDCTGQIALAHNGIVENYAELRDELRAAGHVFTSETDTEVVVHLVESLYEGDLALALRRACKRLRGAWAFLAISSREPGVIVCARKGSPLVVASTEAGAMAASDITPLAPYASDVVSLRDGQFATLRPDGSVEVTDIEGEPSEQDHIAVDWEVSSATLGGYPDFMLKEIAEQPEALTRLLSGRVQSGIVDLDEISMSVEELRSADRVVVAACGTSYHAGLVAKSLIESWAHIPCEVDVASEVLYREVLADDRTLCLVITQSGETAETLLCARKLRSQGARVLAITNVLGSTAARMADGVIYLQAGPEVSVASTKAYTSMLVSVAMIALFLAYHRGRMSEDQVADRLSELERVPAAVSMVLDRQGLATSAARAFEGADSALFLGRGLNASSAKEGALKLKEVSYLHAEAYPSGEMKHGPIALVDEGYPVVFVVPDDAVRDKTISNMAEVKARGAHIIAVATEGDGQVESLADDVMWLPPTAPWCTPITAAVYLQLMARDVAIARGCDVDRPRNLAKSVTTE
ncbi:MAG: glutamine--fructose-6-phosphate transaminase (isomerizing) [Coriobacteriales bacterium]|jgi:glucosamine--fructose-6-phosphate aminotransferase (isomerizing)